MERTVDILIEISIYSAVITAFILLFRAAFKKRISPKVQYAMWLLLVLRLMLPVTIESGFHVESLLPERSAPVVQEESIFDSPVISEMPAVNMAPATDTAPVQPSFDTQNQESAPAVSQEIPESTVVSIAEVKETIFNIRWRIVAFWAWVAGAMAFGLWMMIVKLRFYEDMQQNIASVSPRTYAIYDECCAALGVKPLTMWAVDRAISPGIAFFTYPVLLLPASMDGDKEKLRYAFLHELTHKKRHDHHMTALLTALRMIYWFNPAVHIGFSEMRADMETACDAEVIAFVGREQKRGYLTAILELFSYATRPQLGMSQASSRRMAKQRMKGAFMRERTTFLGRAAALMLAVIMLVGCFTTACQSAPVEAEEVHEETAEAVEPENTPEVNLDEVKTEVWKETYTAGGWLPVSVDTVMDIPLYVNFPVYKMEYYDFTTGKLKHMADKLLGSPTKVALLNDYSEADEPAPSETELSINGQYIYVDSHGQEWSVRSGSRGVNIAKYFPEGALIQTEETVMQGEAYPGEPAGTTIGVQRTWQEAYQYVLDAMDKLGIVNMTLVNYEKARLINSSNEIISKGWNFTLSREDGGRITFYNDRPSAVLMDFEDPEVPLNKEIIRVFVDEAGIENIMWNNPSNVISIITDTHMPFTFEETKGTIKKAFEAIASYTKGRYPDYAITIEDIDLRSCPVQSEAGASSGYLVPAWVMDLTIGEGDSANNHSWLCVSTIDGSIISHAYMTEAGKRIAAQYDNWVYIDSEASVKSSINPIDTLSNMDLLTYAALEQENGIYALPRTLSGMDISVSMWDNLLLQINKRYLDRRPYDAAAVAYSVAGVRRETDRPERITIYLVATYRQYILENGVIQLNGEWESALDWQYEQTGEEEFSPISLGLPYKKAYMFEAGIKASWPEELQKYAFDFSIGRAERLKAIDEQIAISMDNNEKVDELLSTIVSSPKGSSAHIDYIHEHVGEYGQLCAMGRRAVSRFMPRFESGRETGLEGRIMASVVNALTGIGLVYDYANGQEWYDANREEILASEWVTAVQPTPNLTSVSFANAIVSRAEGLIDKKYEIGAYGPETFDSAGFVYYVLFNEGVEVTKQSCQEYSTIGSWQKIEDKADLQPGDILLFHGDYTEKMQHAGIYIGDGKMIDASSANGKVTERSWETDYWQEHFAFARRVA